MGYLIIEFEADRPPGEADSVDRLRTLVIGKAPRAKWLFGYKESDGVAQFSDRSKQFFVTHESPGEYELRIEALSQERPAEDLAFGYTGDAWQRCWILQSVAAQGLPFALHLDDDASDDRVTTPGRTTQTILITNAQAGDTTLRIADKYWGGSITGGVAYDEFAADDFVLIEDIRDWSRFEYAKISSQTDTQTYVLTAGLTQSYESGSTIRHAHYLPRNIATRVRFEERKGRRSPGAGIWDLTLRFVEVRSLDFHTVVFSS